MVMKFATGILESWLYIPTTSAELSISWLSFLWFLILPWLSFLWFLDPFHILSLFWFYEAFIPALVPFVFNLPLNEIARTQFFVRWVDCNTPFPEYVLSCVFRFSIVFFWIVSCIYSVLWIPYMIILSWIWIRGLGVSPSLNQGPDHSILFDMVFPVIRFDRFQFQILFSIIINFLWFSGFFLN